VKSQGKKEMVWEASTSLGEMLQFGHMGSGHLNTASSGAHSRDSKGGYKIYSINRSLDTGTNKYPIDSYILLL
jgi:hypothetical protein